ncbi:unnamed protein product, partial [Closterium sp. NIES-53]
PSINPSLSPILPSPHPFPHAQVRLIDNFTNKKGMTSHCYRITYRSMERSLTDEEINEIQAKVREEAAEKLKITLR